MRDGSAALSDVLTGSFDVVTTADFFRGSDPVMQGVPLVGWSVRHDLSSTVKGSGEGTLVIASVSGESYLPDGSMGALSPFGASIVLTQTISAGKFSERVLIGWFKITRLVDGFDTKATINGREVTIQTVLTFEYRSLDERVQRAGFRSPEQPPSLVSCYAELRRIGLLPVTESMPDVALPGGLTWVAERGGRLSAVQTVANALGGIAIVTAAGQWRVAPNVGVVVATLRLGERGTVLDIGHEVDTDEVYSEVVGVFEATDGTPIYSTASLPLGPVSIEPNIRYAAADWVTTQAAADVHTRGVLEESMRSQFTDRRVVCVTNPLIEVGDFVEIAGWDRPLSGQVRSVDLSDSPLMNVVLRERVVL